MDTVLTRSSRVYVFDMYDRESRRMPMSYVVLFTLQIAFTYARTMGTRHVAKDNVWRTVGWGGVIQVLWLLTTTMSVGALIGGDYLMGVVYIAGGLIGNYYAMIKEIHE